MLIYLVRTLDVSANLDVSLHISSFLFGNSTKNCAENTKVLRLGP